MFGNGYYLLFRYLTYSVSMADNNGTPKYTIQKNVRILTPVLNRFFNCLYANQLIQYVDQYR